MKHSNLGSDMASVEKDGGEKERQLDRRLGMVESQLEQEKTLTRDLRAGLEAEKKLSRELRVENMRVKEDHLRTSTDSESQRAQIQDLRADIQRYVTQVQRIEELLADKDVERRELLEQYKSLSDEMENSLAKARTVSVQLDAAQVWPHLLNC